MVKIVGTGLDIPHSAPSGSPATDYNRLGTNPNRETALALRTSDGVLVPVSLTWMGTWSNAVTYYDGDVVEYEGSAYISISSSVDENPDNVDSDYWELIVEKGADGPLWRGAWFDNIEYHEGDLAEYANGTWYAKQTSTDVPPNSDFDYWQVFAAAGGTGATGAKGATWKGTWGSGTAYAVDDLVEYQGGTFISVQAGTNHVPTPGLGWWEIFALKGSTGSAGADGDDGATGATGATGLVGGAQTWRFTFSTTTTDSDPGAGVLRFNSSSAGGSNRIFIDTNDADGTLISNSIDTLDDSTSTIKGFIKVINRAGTKQGTFGYTATTAGAGYYKLTVSILDEGGGNFTNGEEVFLTFSRTGDKGTTGATGPASTAGGPKIQLNYVEATDLHAGTSLTIDTWNTVKTTSSFTVDSATSLLEIAVRGSLRIDLPISTVCETMTRVKVDSTVVGILGGSGGSQGASQTGMSNPLAGAEPIYVSGISAGSHTITLETYINRSGALMYCRCSTTPNIESLGIQVVEHKLGGLTWVPSGAYSAGTTYALNEVVTYDGSSYVCILSGTGQTPSSSPTYWMLLSAKGDIGTSAATAGGPKIQLDFVESTNIFSGTALTSSTWTTVKTSPSFTVDSVSSLVEVGVRSFMYLIASSGVEVQLRLKVDSTVVAYIGGNGSAVSGEAFNPFAGVEPVYLSGISAGSHTVSVEIFAGASGCTMYLRCAGGTETLGIQIIEHKLGGLAWTPKGAYSAGTAYAVNEVVSYLGSSYIAIQSGTGQTPSSSPTYWTQLVAKGDTGATGTPISPPIAIEYAFSTTTTDSDPGNGILRLNNATQNAATVVRMDSLDAAGVSWANVIDSMDDSPSTSHKGYLRIASKTTPANYLLFSVTLVAAPSGYKNVSVALILSSASSPLTNGETVVATYDRNGDSTSPAYLPLTQQGSAPSGAASVSTVWAESTYGLPQVRIGTASSSNPTLRPKNRFHNGMFRLWPKGTSGAHTTTYSVFSSYLAPRWFVRPAGASNTSSRNAGPGGNSMAYMSLQVIGNTSVTTVDIGQRISQEESQLLQAPGGEYTASFWVWNGTSGVFSPSILINTCNASDNWSALTNRVTATLQTCPVNTWTRVSYTFTPASLTNQPNGTEICLQIPSGSLNVNTKYVLITGAMLEEGGTPTVPEFLSIGAEIAQMAVYWYQSYHWGVAQGTNTPQGAIQTQCDSGSTNQIPGPHFPTMRKTPSAQVYGVSGSASVVSTTGLANFGSSATLQDLGSSGARYISNGSAYSANTAYCYQLVCSAED